MTHYILVAWIEFWDFNWQCWILTWWQACGVFSVFSLLVATGIVGRTSGVKVRFWTLVRTRLLQNWTLGPVPSQSLGRGLELNQKSSSEFSWREIFKNHPECVWMQFEPALDKLHSHLIQDPRSLSVISIMMFPCSLMQQMQKCTTHVWFHASIFSFFPKHDMWEVAVPMSPGAQCTMQGVALT